MHGRFRGLSRCKWGTKDLPLGHGGESSQKALSQGGEGVLLGQVGFKGLIDDGAGPVLALLASLAWRAAMDMGMIEPDCKPS